MMFLWRTLILETVAQNCSLKKVFLEISTYSQENICAWNFIKKEALAQVFSYEVCEIFKNTVFIEHLLATASGTSILTLLFLVLGAVL